MKPARILHILIFLLIPVMSSAQVKVETDSIIPPEDYPNIYVHQIAGDSLSTTFLIFVKESVPTHKHQYHSETVVVLSGTGMMTLGSEYFEIKEGDVIFIPANTWHDVKVTSITPLKVLSIQAPRFDGTDRIFYKKN
jgi:mannose-6-phosphate isomerase-like protein (cupin superfamily)